jgi:cytochrome oxidase assembly protein ShyY1
VYRFLLSWRWLGAFLLALAVAAGCVLLGHWQWDRREQRLARNALVTQNYDSEPVPLENVLVEGRLPATAEWTPVRLPGRYLARDAVLLRNRPLDGRPGYHSLVPFSTDAGPVLLVDRGWLPIGETGKGPAENPAPPTGDVELVVRLRPPEPALAGDRPAGQVYRITPASVPLPEPAADRLVDDAYGVLAQEVPTPAKAPQLLPKPELDEGPHLSYSLQWFVFAVGALAGFVVLIRRTAQDDEPPPPSRHRPRRPTAEEEEDALVDAQLRVSRVGAKRAQSELPGKDGCHGSGLE